MADSSTGPPAVPATSPLSSERQTQDLSSSTIATRSQHSLSTPSRIVSEDRILSPPGSAPLRANLSAIPQRSTADSHKHSRSRDSRASHSGASTGAADARRPSMRLDAATSAGAALTWQLHLEQSPPATSVIVPSPNNTPTAANSLLELSPATTRSEDDELASRLDASLLRVPEPASASAPLSPNHSIEYYDEIVDIVGPMEFESAPSSPRKSASSSSLTPPSTATPPTDPVPSPTSTPAPVIVHHHHHHYYITTTVPSGPVPLMPLPLHSLPNSPPSTPHARSPGLAIPAHALASTGPLFSSSAPHNQQSFHVPPAYLAPGYSGSVGTLTGAAGGGPALGTTHSGSSSVSSSTSTSPRISRSRPRHQTRSASDVSAVSGGPLAELSYSAAGASSHRFNNNNSPYAPYVTTPVVSESSLSAGRIPDRSSSAGAGLNANANAAATGAAAGVVAGQRPHSPPEPNLVPSTSLFVRNINSAVEDAELETLFGVLGPIKSIHSASKHRGFVIITYHELAHAQAALASLNGKLLRRRKLDIHYAAPKKETHGSLTALSSSTHLHPMSASLPSVARVPSLTSAAHFTNTAISSPPALSPSPTGATAAAAPSSSAPVSVSRHPAASAVSSQSSSFSSSPLLGLYPPAPSTHSTSAVQASPLSGPFPNSAASLAHPLVAPASVPPPTVGAPLLSTRPDGLVQPQPTAVAAAALIDYHALPPLPASLVHTHSHSHSHSYSHPHAHPLSPQSPLSPPPEHRQSAARALVSPPARRAQKTGGGERARFELDLERVLSGADIRTTLMIRNIPNKYNQRMLLQAIDVRHHGLYDFFYLPIDTANKCNVGYAFINFLEPRHIVAFSHEFNHHKWERFHSEKVCELSYGRIQGCDALVQHFQHLAATTNHPSTYFLAGAAASDSGIASRKPHSASLTSVVMPATVPPSCRSQSTSDLATSSVPAVTALPSGGTATIASGPALEQHRVPVYPPSSKSPQPIQP